MGIDVEILTEREAKIRHVVKVLVPKIYKYVSKFEHLANRLDTCDDTADLREKLRMTRWYILTLLNETRAALILIRKARDSPKPARQGPVVHADDDYVETVKKYLSAAQEKFLIAQIDAKEMIAKYACFLPTRQDVVPLKGQIEVFPYGAVLADENDCRELTSYRQRYQWQFLLMTVFPVVIGFLWLMNMLGGFEFVR